MKLLSPSEVRDIKAQETSRDILRTKELNQAAESARKKLADAEADFSKMLAGQQMRWAKEEQEHSKDVAARQRELEVLEARRLKALEPVILLEERANKALLEAQNQVIEAEKRENDATDLYEKLQDSLDDVGQREVDLLKYEKEVLAHDKNLEFQQKAADEQSRFVAERMLNLKTEEAKVKEELGRLRTALTLQEHSLNARAEKLARTETKLAEWEKRLASERDTLDRAFKRLNIIRKPVDRKKE